MTSVPVFHPNAKDLQGHMCDYIESLEKRFAKQGICVLHPPEGWCPPHKQEPGRVIPRPIQQHFTGSRGVYRTLLVERKPLTLAEFQALAEADPCQPPEGEPPEGVERRFWRSLTTLRAPCYGADVDGSLFHPSVKGWNMNGLQSMLSRVLGAKGYKIPGVTSPYLYFGQWRSIFAWHTEDCDLASMNYLHAGKPKTWYCVPPAHRERFERLVQGMLPDLFRACPEFFRHKELLISPQILRQHGIPVLTVVQRPGQYVVTAPGAYHCGFNHGFNCAESTNFALKSWLSVGLLANTCTCQGDSVAIRMGLFLDEASPRLRKLILEQEASSSSSSSSGSDSGGSEEELEAEVTSGSGGESNDDGAEASSSPGEGASTPAKGSCEKEEEEESSSSGSDEEWTEARRRRRRGGAGRGAGKPRGEASGRDAARQPQKRKRWRREESAAGAAAREPATPAKRAKRAKRAASQPAAAAAAAAAPVKRAGGRREASSIKGVRARAAAGAGTSRGGGGGGERGVSAPRTPPPRGQAKPIGALQGQARSASRASPRRSVARPLRGCSSASRASPRGSAARPPRGCGSASRGGASKESSSGRGVRASGQAQRLARSKAQRLSMDGRGGLLGGVAKQAQQAQQAQRAKQVQQAKRSTAAAGKAQRSAAAGGQAKRSVTPAGMLPTPGKRPGTRSQAPMTRSRLVRRG